jgi:hypothetical protein
MFVGMDANILSYQPEKEPKGISGKAKSFVKAGAVIVCVPRLSDPWGLGGAIISHELFALFKVGFLLS